MSNQAPLDTLLRVETPEGITLKLHAAGVLPRALAWLLDFAIRVLAALTASVVLVFLGDAGVGLYLVLLFALVWLYPVLFEVLRDGQTIGKRALGLKVIHANGTPVSWLASIVRNLLRTVDMLPLCYGVGLLAGLIDPYGRRLGDLVAGTLVVHVPPAPISLAPNASIVLPEVALAPAEKAAIVAYAERAPLLTIERQEELAQLLTALTGARGQAAVQRLFGMACGFLGRQ